MATPTSPARRVLGDKTTNASVHRHPHQLATKPQLGQSMSDRPHVSAYQAAVTRTMMKVSPKAGQKRRIHEVDGTEEQGQLEQGKPRSSSPLTVVSTEPNSEADERGWSSTAQTKSSVTTLFTSFQASQEPPAPLEDQFEIQDEMSQQTLDKIVSPKAALASTHGVTLTFPQHATTLPQATSQLQPLLRPVLTAENSQESIRMSSFIDFESNDPEDDNLKMISTTPTKSAEDRARRADLDEVWKYIHDITENPPANSSLLTEGGDTPDAPPTRAVQSANKSDQ